MLLIDEHLKLFKDYNKVTYLQENRFLKAFSFCVSKDIDSSFNYSISQKTRRTKYKYNTVEIYVLSSEHCQSIKLIKNMLHQRFLTEIIIEGANIQDQGMQLIFQAHWKFIKHIQLENNQITEKGVKYIVKCGWKFLTHLNLSNNKIGNKGVSQLAKGCWPKLQGLTLKNCGLSTCSMRLFEKGMLKTLQKLDVSQNSINSSCLKYLITHNSYKLKELNYVNRGYQIVYQIYRMNTAKVPNPFKQLITINNCIVYN